MILDHDENCEFLKGKLVTDLSDTERYWCGGASIASNIVAIEGVIYNHEFSREVSIYTHTYTELEDQSGVYVSAYYNEDGLYVFGYDKNGISFESDPKNGISAASNVGMAIKGIALAETKFTTNQWKFVGVIK